MTANRRTVLGGGLTSAAAIAAGIEGLRAQAIGAEHPALESGEKLSRDANHLAAFADDFGHLVRKRPRAVLKPASAGDIAEAVRWAGSQGLTVAARGKGHSTYGRAMVDGGIVIDMRTMRKVHRVESDCVVVEAGATWEEVLDATLPRGLAPPVLTNYLGLSVGGTLAVGGIGGSTSRHGMQTDSVVELDVVTGDGRELTCSAEINPDLFNAARAGLGQCAIITRATLRLVPAPERVLRLQLFYPDLRSLTADQDRLLAEDRFDQLQGAVLPDGARGWRYQLEGAVFYNSNAPPDQKALAAELSDDRSAAAASDLSYPEDAASFARLEKLLRSNGHWLHPHPWLLTFLPTSKAERIANEILEGLTQDEVGPLGRVTYYPLHTRALQTPLIRMPQESVAVTFNIIRIPASNDMAAAQRMVTGNRALYERVRREGGVLYPVSAFPMSGEDWKAHFGMSWPWLDEARRRYASRHTLTPGYEVA
jgi:cytokinin dehydrogenase